MKPQRDIFDIFGDSARKMRVSPSSRTWNKLDRKMSRSRYGHRAYIYRWMAMAASIVLLLGVITLMADRVKKRKTAMLGKSMELTDLTNDDFESYDGVFVSYSDYKEKRIVEGNEVAKFVVNTDVDASAGKKVRTIDAGKTTKAPGRKDATEIATKEESPTVIEPATASAESRSVKEEVADEVPASDDLGYPVANETTLDTVNAREDISGSVAVMDGVEIDSWENRDRHQRIKKLKKEKVYETAISVKSMPEGLQQFDWLLGNWAENRQNGQSIENWRKINATTLAGKGKLLRDGKEVYTEEMSITEKNGDIFFNIPDGDGRLTVAYRLIHRNEKNFSFENDSQFLNRLIVSHVSDDTVKIILENTKNGEIPERQQQILNQRNAVLSNSAVRNMSRVKNKKG